MIRVFYNGGLRAVSRMTVMYGGTLRRVRSVKIMTGGQLRTVALFTTPLSPTASPSSLFRSGVARGGGVRVTTGTTTVSPNGGTGPYSYSWQIVDGPSMVIDAPNNAQTSFTLAEGPGMYESIARCTVTDSFGQTGSTDVGVTITIVQFGGGPIE